MSIKEHYRALVQKRAELEKEILELSKAAFTEEAATLFEKHPILESFSWTQYSPYFNDGDECVFGVNIDYGMKFKFNVKDATLTTYYVAGLRRLRAGTPSTYDGPMRDLTAHESAVLDVHDALEAIDEDVFREMFGNHVQITVARDGSVSVDEYDHE